MTTSGHVFTSTKRVDRVATANFDRHVTDHCSMLYIQQNVARLNFEPYDFVFCRKKAAGP